MRIQPALLYHRPKGPDRPWRLDSDFWVAGTGAMLGGGTGALAGAELGRQYGPRLLREALPHALALVQNGWISLDTALQLYSRLLHPAAQAQLGAVGIGGLGAMLGATAAMALWESTRQKE